MKDGLNDSDPTTMANETATAATLGTGHSTRLTRKRRFGPAAEPEWLQRSFKLHSAWRSRCLFKQVLQLCYSVPQVWGDRQCLNSDREFLAGQCCPAVTGICACVPIPAHAFPDLHPTLSPGRL